MGWIGGRHFLLQYKFGDKTVTICSQIHCWSIPIPFLLSSYLFGENFEKLNIVAVKSTKKTRLIHIWSNERAMLMLSIENKNAVQFMNVGKWFYGCRKLVIVFTKHDEYFGGTNAYILGEKRGKWQVKTSNNLELLVTPPTLRRFEAPNTNHETYDWEFVQSDSYKKFRFYVEDSY